MEARVPSSNSLQAVRLVAKVPVMFHPYATVIGAIQSLQRREWEVTFTHVLREGNAVADVFAKLGATSTGAFVVHEHPPLRGSRIF